MKNENLKNVRGSKRYEIGKVFRDGLINKMIMDKSFDIEQVGFLVTKQII